MTDLNLPSLRAIAEAATQGEWKRCASRPWDIQASGSPVAEVYADEDVAFVTTFSPVTDLALIDRTEKAEAALAEARVVLEWIAAGDTEVFDDDLQMNVQVTADADELSEPARNHLAKTEGAIDAR